MWRIEWIEYFILEKSWHQLAERFNIFSQRRKTYERSALVSDTGPWLEGRDFLDVDGSAPGTSNPRWDNIRSIGFGWDQVLVQTRTLEMMYISPNPTQQGTHGACLGVGTLAHCFWTTYVASFTVLKSPERDGGVRTGGNPNHRYTCSEQLVDWPRPKWGASLVVEIATMLNNFLSISFNFLARDSICASRMIGDVESGLFVEAGPISVRNISATQIQAEDL